MEDANQIHTNPEGQDTPTPDEGETRDRAQRAKFPEPRAWALNWDTSDEPVPLPWTGESAAPQQEPAVEDKDREKFPHPRGWALKWDGFSISAIHEYYNGHTGTQDTGIRQEGA